MASAVKIIAIQLVLSSLEFLLSWRVGLGRMLRFLLVVVPFLLGATVGSGWLLVSFTHDHNHST